MIKMIADYKNNAGEYLHNSYIAPLCNDTNIAINALNHALRQKGYIPVAIHIIDGDYTLQELIDASNNIWLAKHTNITDTYLFNEE